MRKSVQAVLSSRSYSHTAWHVLNSVLRLHGGAASRFVAERERGATAVVVISGNRGLAGSFNGNIADAVIAYARENGLIPQMNGGLETVNTHGDGSMVVVTLGTKVRDELIARGMTVEADFLKSDVITSSTEIEPLIRYLFDEYSSRSLKRVVLCYTDFESALRQTVRIRTLLPLSLSEDPYLGVVHNNTHASEDDKEEEYDFDQDQGSILSTVIPRILEAQLFQAVLESQASEHSARMIAMKNATEAASDMISELTLEYNKQRQSAITQELAEIAASRMALAG